MHLSKKHLLFIFFSLWVLSGCNPPKPNKRDPESGSSFYFVNQKGSFTATQFHSGFSIPKSRIFNAQVCLKSYTNQQSIPNHRFEILGGPQTQQVTTNSEGCLSWDETLEFNAFAKAKYLLLERDIRALKGNQLGTRKIQWIVSPWSNFAKTPEEVKWPSQTYVSGEQIPLALKGEGDSRRIWVDQFIATIAETRASAEGSHLEVDLSAAVKYESIDEAGQKKLEPLTSGTFKARFFLIHSVSENGREVRRRFSADSEIIQTQIDKETLLIRSPLVLNRLCTRGMVYLAVRLDPLNAPEGLKGFEGVYNIAECDSLKGRAWAKLRTEYIEKNQNDAAYSIQKYLGEAPEPATDIQKKDKGTESNYQSSRVELSRVELSNAGVLNTSSILRTRKFDLRLTARMGLDQKILRGQVFQVTKLNGETTEVKSLNDGTLFWQDSLTYNIFDQECWAQKSIQIQNSDLGLNQTVQVLVNPWSEATDVGRDLRYTDPKLAKEECASGQTRLFATDLQFQKTKFDYSVDRFLRLEVKKTGILRINLRLQRPSLTNLAGLSDEALPIGPYLLRVVIADPSLNQNSSAQGKIFDATEQVVRNQGGSALVGTFTLGTKNVRALGNLNQVFIEVLPLRPEAETLLKQNPQVDLKTLVHHGAPFQSAAFRGTFMMANNNESTALVALEGARGSWLETLIQQKKQDEASELQKFELASRPEVYAQENQLRYLRSFSESETLKLRQQLANPVGLSSAEALSTQEFNENIHKGISERIRKSLCALWFTKWGVQGSPENPEPLFGLGLSPGRASTLALECQRRAAQNISQMFDLEKKVFVTEAQVDGVVRGQVRDLNISQSFSMGHSKSVSTSWSIGAALGAGVSQSLGFLSANLGLQGAWTKSWNESEDQGNSQTFSNGVNLQVETLKVPLRIKKGETCLAIRLNPLLFEKEGIFRSSVNSKLTTAQRQNLIRSGLLLCDDSTRGQVERIQESYYVLNQNLFTAQAMDVQADQNRPLFTVLRGTRDFTRFLSFLYDSAHPPRGFQTEVQTASMLQTPFEDVFRRGFPEQLGSINLLKDSVLLPENAKTEVQTN